MTQLDEQAYLAILERHLTTSKMIAVQFDPMCAFMLVGTLQLALRHPGNTGDTSRVMRQFTDDLIERIANGNETVAELLHRGDDPEFDALFVDDEAK